MIMELILMCPLCGSLRIERQQFHGAVCQKCLYEGDAQEFTYILDEELEKRLSQEIKEIKVIRHKKEQPEIDLTWTYIQILIEDIEKYGFRDLTGHLLLNCIDWQRLKQMIKLEWTEK